jgi:murein DD-endopeptidase MepM/ murein hydrolase activator NlpD
MRGLTFRIARFAVAAGIAAVVVLAGGPAAAAGWRWPLAGHPVVVRGFDPPALPWGAGHRGVDLRARPDQRVLAAGAGVVGFVGTIAGIGVVTVHHPDGLETTYEPVRPAVVAGEHVVLGAVLGRVLAGHGDCGPGFVCLHWGLRRGAAYLDPLALLGAVRLRLFPAWPQSVVGRAGDGVRPAVRHGPRVRHARTATTSDPLAGGRAGPALAITGIAALSGVWAERRRRRQVTAFGPDGVRS